MKTGAIIQARSASTRLPQKVLKELPFAGGITVLEQVIRRLDACSKLDEVIVATTTDVQDDSIVDVADRAGVVCFRGSMDDVLSRYYHAAERNDLDVVVRVTSDCPCIDPKVIARLVKEHIENQADFSSNILTRTYPHGMDAEVMGFNVLEEAFNNATETFEREHVCPYIYKSNPDKFRIHSVRARKDLTAPDIRITLDTSADYALLCSVYDNLYGENEMFGTEEIIQLFERKPWLGMISKSVVHKKVCSTLDEEVTEAVRLLSMQDLNRARELLESRISTGCLS